MNKWKPHKLSEIGSVVGGATPSTTVDAYYNGDIPWLTPKDLSDFHERYIERGERNITKSGLNSCSAQLLPAGSVLFSSRAPIGYVAIAKNPIATNQGFKSIIPNPEKVDSLFLYYLLKYNKDNIEAMGSGTTFKEVSGATMKNIEVYLPEDLDEQRRIAEILGSLDDKIELNRRINANLEAQAQALFRSWFVDFEPFRDGPFVDSELGKIPQGWKTISLSELMNYAGGSQPPASEFINSYKDGYVRFIQIRDYASESHITYIPISSKNKTCDIRDIMIARYGASLGRICYGLKGAYNVALAKVLPVKPYYREFLRSYLSSDYFYQSINMKGNRAVQAGFNQSDINSFRLNFPKDESIIQTYDKVCSQFLNKRLQVLDEIKALSALRDTLLPKLMDGEIAIE